jgi:hypothetical protein
MSVPERWRYGDAGDRWPVQPGEVWAVGAHRVACGDVEEGAIEQLLAAWAEPVDLAYVDPPWNAGNARAFRTKAGLGRPVDYLRLVELIGLGIDHSGARYACVESGRGGEAEIRAALVRAGLRHVQSWDIVYYRTRPARLHLLAGRGTPDPERLPAFHGVDDENTPALAVSTLARRGQTVFDPCCGRGTTAIAAHLAGCRFLGLELHPRRLAVAIDKLVGLGVPPGQVRRVGRLA